MAKRKEQMQTFHARLVQGGDRALGWTVVALPFRPADVWSERVRQRVCGTVNGFAFRSSLFPDPERPGEFVLMINRATQAGGGAKLGDMAVVTLEPDLAPRPAELPERLEALLDEVDELREFYDGLSETVRRELGKWILAVKSEDAQARRCEAAAERLLHTMEAEQEPPAWLRAGFKRRPRAAAGWKAMTLVQRRGELMGVFYYASPESRARRVEKLLDAAEARAERASKT